MCLFTVFEFTTRRGNTEAPAADVVVSTQMKSSQRALLTFMGLQEPSQGTCVKVTHWI